jgi:DNA-binding PadR family transcriptional regulator
MEIGDIMLTYSIAIIKRERKWDSTYRKAGRGMSKEGEGIGPLVHSGLSHKDIFSLAVLQLLDERGEEYGYPLFEEIEGKLLGKEISQSNFYVTLGKMVDQGLIREISTEDGRKNVYAITAEGQAKREWYRNNYVEQFSAVKQLADVFAYDITRNGIKPVIMELKKDYQRFYGKLVHVRRLIEYVILKTLQSERKKTPSELLKLCLAKYGWQPGKMYLYEVIWDMEAKGWIEGQWDGPKRHHRNYFLTEAGVRIYAKVEEESLHSVQMVQIFLKSVLELMK